MKFKELFLLWKEYKKSFVKRSSISAYSLLAQNHLIPVFGELEDIIEVQVQDFVISTLNKGLSQKTVKDILIVLKMVMKFGAKRKLFEYLSFELQFPTDHERKKMEVLTVNEYKRLLNHVKENFTFKNLGIQICLSTGLRIGEICGLKWSDVDLDYGLIHVRRTIQRIYIIDDDIKKTELILDSPKTKGSIREIPMSKDLLDKMKPIKKIVNDEYFVLSNEIKPIEPRSYRAYYDKILKQLGMPELKFHGMRHTFATRCIESKADIKTVSTILGHANISTTLNLYTHPNNEHKKKAIDDMFKSMR